MIKQTLVQRLVSKALLALNPIQLKYPLGIDVAYNNCNTHWDETLQKDVETPPDWSAPIAPWPDFVICKASQSTYIEDFTFNSNWKQLGAKGKPRGAYHFYRADRPSGSQATWFVNIVNKAGGIKPGDILVMDWEEEGKMSLKAIIDFIWNVRRLTGIAPERTPLYSRALLLNALNFNGLTQAEKDYIKTIPLWIAGTFNDPATSNQYPTIPSMFIPDQSKWAKPVIWQYALDINPVGLVSGIPGGLDFNWIDPLYFESWKSLTGGIIPPDDDPPIDPIGDKMYTGKVKDTAPALINIRKTPDGLDVGDLARGQAITGDNIVDGVSPYKWMHVLTPLVGYVRTDLLDYQEVTTPVGLPVLHMTATADGYETKTFDINPL